MAQIFINDPNTYEKSLIRQLFHHWSRQIVSQSDASGVTSSMDIDAEFRRTLVSLETGDEFSGVPVVSRVDNENWVTKEPYLAIHIAALYGNERITVTETQARMLHTALGDFLKKLMEER